MNPLFSTFFFTLYLILIDKIKKTKILILKEYEMEVYLNKNIAKIGLEGEIIKVEDGFARNFLIPKGLVTEITEKNKHQFETKIRVVQNRKEIIANETSMLSDKISMISITIKKKMIDNGQLYGSISAHEIVDALAKEGITITKNQVEFDKPIKTKGTFKVTIKLTSRLKSNITVVIASE
jgi:large subunit ribosomal protein L9